MLRRSGYVKNTPNGIQNTPPGIAAMIIQRAQEQEGSSSSNPSSPTQPPHRWRIASGSVTVAIAGLVIASWVGTTSSPAESAVYRGQRLRFWCARGVPAGSTHTYHVKLQTLNPPDCSKKAIR